MRTAAQIVPYLLQTTGFSRLGQGHAAGRIHHHDQRRQNLQDFLDQQGWIQQHTKHEQVRHGAQQAETPAHWPSNTLAQITPLQQQQQHKTKGNDQRQDDRQRHLPGQAAAECP